MILRITAVALLLALFIQCVEVYEKIVVVSESNINENLSNNLSHNKDDLPTVGSRVKRNNVNSSHTIGSTCCIYGNCSCPSINGALANITSNTLINITADVWLSEIIEFSNSVDIYIFGHNNPKVTCFNAGSLLFKSCSNYVIEGITWEGCGSRSHGMPVFGMYNSSNITVKNCLFQHSEGQVVVLSGVSGNVSINHCSFKANGQHGNHGIAIYYISTTTLYYDLINFVINNCTFSYNEGESIVYLGYSYAQLEWLYLQDSDFHHNKGVPIYLSNKTLHIDGNNDVFGNVAENGGGIFINDHSKVVFYKTARVYFRENIAKINGGALYIDNNSIITFEGNSVVELTTNEAYGDGGAMYIDNNSIITFEGNSTVWLRTNKASYGDGGAIYIDNNSIIAFEGNSVPRVELTTNEAYGDGGAMYINNSIITFEEYSAVWLRTNKASYGDGGAICIDNNSIITFEGNSVVELTTNEAYGDGGAMYINNSIITFEEYSAVWLRTNKASYGDGGAICIDNNSIITFEGNSVVELTTNEAYGDGGAMYINNSIIIFEGNSAVWLRTNKASYGDGGAIYIDNNSIIAFEGNSVVELTTNEANGDGGAMYIDNNSIITFEEYSAVWLVTNEANGDGGAMYIDNNSIITFEGNSVVKLTTNEAYGDGGAMYINNSIITFEEYSAVWLVTNEANGDGGAMYIDNNSIITFEGNSVVKLTTNEAYGDGGAMYINNSIITFKEYSAVWLVTNEANGDGGAMYIDNNSIITFEGNSVVKLTTNGAYGDGGAMYIDNNSTITFEEYSAVWLVTNEANGDGGAMYIDNNSIIAFEGNSVVKLTTNGAYGDGGAMYIDNNSIITFEEYSAVWLVTNEANGDGGAMYIDNNSIITFEGNSVVKLTANEAYGDGGAVYIDNNSIITFEGNSVVELTANEAYGDGGAMYIDNNSIITFEGNSTVFLTTNKASRNAFDNVGAHINLDFYNPTVISSNGGAMYIDYSSTVIFQGNCSVTFDHNRVDSNGGAMYINNNSTATCKDTSRVIFAFNNAGNGGAVYLLYNSTFMFEENSFAKFTHNYDAFSGAFYVYNYSTVRFRGNSMIILNSNEASSNGGAMYIGYYSIVIFEGKSEVLFDDNKASANGGAMYIDNLCTVGCKEDSNITFSKNRIQSKGGALYINTDSNITFEGNSLVAFSNNGVGTKGGAVCVNDHSAIMCRSNATVTFSFNIADSGGAVHLYNSSTITFEGNSNVTFTSNYAINDNGGVIYTLHYSTVICNGKSKVTFYNNLAYTNGGVVSTSDYSNVTIKGDSTLAFYNNTANDNGGAVHVYNNSTVKTGGNSMITFYNNMADNDGGAVYIDQYSTAEFDENSRVTFHSNTACLGGSIFSESSQINIEGNCSIEFANNTALQDGGAIYMSDHSNFTLFNSNVRFYYNTADDYGGAVYVLLRDSLMSFNSSNIYFKGNTAGSTQNSVYINVPKSFFGDNVSQNININSRNSFTLTTSPNKLILHDPVKCINFSTDATYCHTYYVNNIMLGKEITFDACVLDYFDQRTEATQFLVTGINHQDYNITGSKYILVSCNQTTQRLSIIGNLHANHSYNYSITITLYAVYISESKTISTNLIVELSQCHPGFWYSSESQKCECYDTENIISCSGSDSTIKRGYWFGSVNGKPTVTFCPNDYCNFTCCEITNGIYHLSPVRANQCRSHRSGTACGNCEKGYTLSFDSPECVEVNKCTTGQTVLVITLSLLYLIAVVVTVFAMMYFKVTVGSLYAIIYYYSVVDILLSQLLFISNGLYTTVSIMSSLAKLTPQFLGQLCLVQNMSGIDQQFIHYVHPTVISLILIMISMLARRSHRISKFISGGIIHFICFFLLLSYTSVATTSLLLMRPLKFNGVDRIYTYLSPDIEYFHDRHLAYVIVTILFTIVIVIGFPLLLLLEPFLNSKINFIKIKPLLDQFQCCYKDKYRYFAGYYMICRLVIILLVIVRIFDEFTTQYLVISACALMQLIHVLVRPYANTILNVFDGMILQLIVIISALPIDEFVDKYDETSALVIIYILVIWPLISFIGIKLCINKKRIKTSYKYFKERCSHMYRPLHGDDVEEPIEENEIGIIIDDSMRRNALIVDV